MVAVVIGSFLELLAVSLFQPFINLIMDTSSLKDSRIMSYVYARFGFDEINYFLAMIAGIIIAVYIVKIYISLWRRMPYISFPIVFRERCLQIF